MINNNSNESREQVKFLGQLTEEEFEKLKRELQEEFPADIPSLPNNPALIPAWIVLKEGVGTVNSLSLASTIAPAAQTKGALTRHGQDQLRGMLVMAGACLDATMKQVIRSTLPILAEQYPPCRLAVRKHLRRQITRDVRVRQAELLTETLLSPNPKMCLYRSLADELVGSSLQSAEQLRNVHEILGLSDFASPRLLREAFEARNQIVHEMDVLPADPPDRRAPSRRERDQQTMRDYAACLVGVALSILKRVDEALAMRQDTVRDPQSDA